MEEPEPYSIKVTPDPERPDRFRWSLYLHEKLRDQSDETFATSGDAALAAVRAIEKRRLASNPSRHAQT